MILVIGGYANGKREFVQSLGYSQGQMSDKPHDGLPVLYDAQYLVCSKQYSNASATAESLADKQVVICTDVGGGVVPIDPEERSFREQAGRLAVALAERASCVVRVCCGIPQVLKGSLPGSCGEYGPEEERPEEELGAACGPAYLSVYRHAPTRANRAHKYQGKMDEPLDWEGESFAYAIEPSQSVRVVYVSHLSRSRQTARILFPKAEQVVVEDLAEMDFGDFDGFDYEQLSDDPRYAAWLETNCESECPNGESRADFAARIERGIRTVLLDAECRGVKEAVIVAHGGTAMAAFWALSNDKRDYFDWHIGVCEGLRGRVERVDGQGVRLTDVAPVKPSESFV